MSRNLSLLLSIALLAPALGGGPVAAQPPGRWFVAPSAYGDGSADSPDNAAPISALDRVVAHAAGGDEVILLVGRGEYRPGSINLTSGGDPGAPITVRGGSADGAPARAVIAGDRANPWSAGSRDGGETIRLHPGADDLHLSGIAFRDVGSAIRVVGDLTGLEVSDVEAVNVRRFLDTLATGSQPSASLTNSVIRDVSIHGYSKMAIRLQYNSHDVLLEDVIGDSQRQNGDNFAMGVHLTGTTHDVILRRVGMHNSHDSTHSYWNGDGFATERSTYRIRFEATSATGSTDGGYDLKSSDTVLIATHAADNKRNYRFWGSATVIGCVGEVPNHRGGPGSPAQVWVDGEASGVALYGCTFTQAQPHPQMSIEPGAQFAMEAQIPEEHLTAHRAVIDATGTEGINPLLPPPHHYTRPSPDHRGT